MSAIATADRRRASALKERLAKLVASLLLALAAFTVAFAGLPPFAAQAAVYDPFVTVIMPDRIGKPNQQVLRYEVREGAAQYLVDGGKYLDTEALRKVTEATLAHDRNTFYALVAEEGWGWYALSSGWTGAAGTFAEHAMKVPGLSNATNALTNIGGAITVLQVGIDLAKGDTKQASVDALKGLTGFAIGKLGSSALQLGGVAFFVVDLTLTTVGTTAWSEREQAWRHVYRKYYREKSEAATRASAAGDDLKSRYREIRSRADGGRSLNDWKVIVETYFSNAKSPEYFKQWLDADIDAYVAKFWDSPEVMEYSADGDWSTAGFARASSLTDKIKRTLQAEHADAIRSTLVKKVFPEVQKRAVQAALEAEAKRLNGDWRKTQNEMLIVEVSAFDIKEPTRFEMLLPNGGSWAGTIAPGQPRKLQISRIAFTQAGFPDTVRLHAPEGDVDKSFTFENGVAVVVFGTPQSSMVTELSRTETELSCTLKTTDLDGKVVQTSSTRPAPGSTAIHMATNPDGTLIMGHYALGPGWVEASPGAWNDTGLSFGAPYFEGIASLSGCDLGRSAHDFYGAFAEQSCTVTRSLIEKAENGDTREVTCTSQMTLKLVGGFAPVDGVMIYSPLDEKLFGTIQKGYESAVEQMKSMPGGAGINLPDLSQFAGGQ